MAKKKEALTPEQRLQEALVPCTEWPYKVPENWCWTRLGQIITSSKEKTEDFSDYSIKYIGLEHMQKDGGIIGVASVEGVKSLKNVFHPGCILYGKLRPYLNKHDIANFDGVCSTDILVFKPSKITTSKYVNYFLNQRGFIEYAVANSKGINLPRVSESVVLDAVCPLPPLAEQQRIVDRIESLFAKLDEAKQKAQDALDSFEPRKAAILHKAFTGELTAQWRKEHGIGIESWKNKRFDDCIEKMQNGLAKRQGDIGNPVIVLRLANLSDDGFIEDDLRAIILDEREQNKYLLIPEDVLMIRVNGSKDNVAKQFLFNKDSTWAFCDHIIRIKYRSILLPAYMVYFSKTQNYRIYVKDNMVSSAGQNTISRKGMSNLEVPVPTLDEQQEIVRIVDDLLIKEQQSQEAAEAVLEQIDLIKKSILARAFRGELGTNDPTEESSIDLLKEILEKEM